jgi:site-specific recombinase XerD
LQKKLTARTVKSLKPKHARYEVVDTDLPGFIARVEPSGVISYSLLYRNQAGSRVRLTLGKNGKITAAQARVAAKKRLGEVALGRDPQAAKREARAKSQVNLNKFVEADYGDWLKINRKSGRATAARLKSAFSSSLGKRYLGDLTPARVEAWRSRRMGKGILPQTINRDVAALRACLAKAKEWGLLDVHPLAELKPLKVADDRRVRYLSKAEEKRLRGALSNRDEEQRKKRRSYNKWCYERNRPMLPEIPEDAYADYLTPAVLVSLNTGLRRSELFGLQWCNVRLKSKNPMLTVAAATAKGSKSRHVPLNQEALQVMRVWRKCSEAEYVFCGKTGDRLTSAKTSWRNLLLKARIDDFRWHDMRHHFASQLVMAGVDLNTVRELLGHSDLSMTLRYAHLGADHKLDAVRRLDK